MSSGFFLFLAFLTWILGISILYLYQLYFLFGGVRVACLILSFALTQKYCMLSEEAVTINYIVFGLTRSEQWFTTLETGKLTITLLRRLWIGADISKLNKLCLIHLLLCSQIWFNVLFLKITETFEKSQVVWIRAPLKK